MHNSIAPALEPVAFGTPTPPDSNVTRLRSQLKRYKSAVAADIENEVHGGSGRSSMDAGSSIAGDPADEEPDEDGFWLNGIPLDVGCHLLEKCQNKMSLHDDLA